MKLFNKTALIVLLTAVTTIACTNQEVVEDMNYKVNDIQEIEVTRIVEEQEPANDYDVIDLPTGKRDPIINVKRDKD